MEGELIYRPIEGKKLGVVLFGSGSGNTLEMLLQKSGPSDSYAIAAVVTDRECRCNEIAEEYKLPLLYLSYAKFMRGCSESLPPEAKRSLYEEELIARLEGLSKAEGFSIDILLLAGYMRIVTKRLLEKYPNRVLNIHPADLTIKDSSGKRRYVGASAVYDALMAGERATRSTMIIADEGVDTGPIIAMGPSLDYDGGLPVTVESAKRHQERQKKLSDLPLARELLQRIGEGRGLKMEAIGCVE